MHWAPDSEASTVPATEKELEEAKQKRKEVGAELVTPPSKLMKVKKSESAETFSEPKLSRAVHSKSVLEAKPGDERKVSATAVKAKAAPKQPLTIAKPEQSQQDAKRAQAVHDCLRRPSTGDMAVSQPRSKDPKDRKTAGDASGADPPTPPEDPPDDDGDGSDSESEEARKARQIRAKRMAHARYMRFSRSLQSS